VEINYGIIAIDTRDHDGLGLYKDGTRVLHFCGYENEPTAADYAALLEELHTDPEFAIDMSFALVPAHDELVKQMAYVVKQVAEIVDEIADENER